MFDLTLHRVQEVTKRKGSATVELFVAHEEGLFEIALFPRERVGEKRKIMDALPFRADQSWTVAPAFSVHAVKSVAVRDMTTANGKILDIRTHNEEKVSVHLFFA